MDDFLADLERFVGERVSFDEGVAIVAQRARRQVEEDVRNGIVPSSVRTFSELHDHVDANWYGDAFSWPGPLISEQGEEYAQACCSFWNRVQGEVDDWLKAGRP